MALMGGARRRCRRLQAVGAAADVHERIAVGAFVGDHPFAARRRLLRMAEQLPEAIQAAAQVGPVGLATARELAFGRVPQSVARRRRTPCPPGLAANPAGPVR